MTPNLSLYQQVLGADFDKLPEKLAAFHRRQGNAIFSGETEVQGPQILIARCLARLLGTPRQSGYGPIRFELAATPLAERWTRVFLGTTMTSVMQVANGRIVERLGAARLYFDLVIERNRLQMKLVAMRFLGIPCPACLLPRIIAEESEHENRFCFNIEASVPCFGRVVSYRGFLNIDEEKAL